LHNSVRIALAPMLATLQIMEFADTEARPSETFRSGGPPIDADV